MWELSHKEGWALKKWCFWTVVLEKTLESLLDCKKIKPVNSKGNQSWIFIGRSDAEAEVLILWPPDARNWFIGKDPGAGKDWRQEGMGTTEDEIVGWHHRVNGHEFEQALGVGDGQGNLACCSDWTELNLNRYTQILLNPPGLQTTPCFLGGRQSPSPPYFAWKLNLGKRIQERSKAESSPYVLPTSQNPPRWIPSWLSKTSTTRKDLKLEWLARDNLETNPTTKKPEVVSHMAEQSSWFPLPCCSLPRHPFPIKSLALSACVSPWTNHFQSVRQEPILRPWNQSPFL